MRRRWIALAALACALALAGCGSDTTNKAADQNFDTADMTAFCAAKKRAQQAVEKANALSGSASRAEASQALTGIGRTLAGLALTVSKVPADQRAEINAANKDYRTMFSQLAPQINVDLQKKDLAAAKVKFAKLASEFDSTYADVNCN